jgi:hypothetical protein
LTQARESIANRKLEARRDALKTAHLPLEKLSARMTTFVAIIQSSDKQSMIKSISKK